MPTHLIHIGYPKAASTFLQEWFRRNPQMQFSTQRLAGFPNTSEVCQFASSDNKSHIKYFVTSAEHFIYPNVNLGENVPMGISDADKFPIVRNIQRSQINICDTLKELFPNGKVLIITRGFNGILKSGYSQLIRFGGRLTFDQYCELIRHNMANFFNYNFLIDTYIKKFGEDNVIVLPFELLAENKNRFLTHLEEILGLESFDKDIKPLNKSLSDQDLFWYVWLSTFINRLSGTFGSKFQNNFYKLHLYLLRNYKLQGLVVLLKKLMPNKSIHRKDIPEELLYEAGQQATILKRFPIYEPYLKDYYLPSDN